MDIKLNGKLIEGVKVKELASDFQSKIGYKLAVETTKQNGIDEIFFEKNNKKYVLYSDDLYLSNIQTDEKMPLLELNGEEVKVLKVQNEVNSSREKVISIGWGALKSAAANGFGGAAGGALVGALGLGVSAAPGALVGFISGAAWGAGSSIVFDLKYTVKQADYSTINEITN